MRTLLSVNVGLPRDVPWRGRTVRTAIFKSPVPADDRRYVRHLNVDGDGQADLVGHGGEHRAVYVYDQSAYDHWSDVLGRDDLVPGHFGENFTVAGMPDDEVCVGDRYRIGEALFEVTQPRVSCYKVGLRLEEPRMPALLYSQGRPGYYLRVLEEGEVGAGDEIERVAVGPEEMSVREVSALLYLPGHTPAGLRRALAIPALSEGWQGSFRALLEQHEEGAAGNRGIAPPSSPPAWSGLRELRVAAVRQESASVRSFLLEPVDGTALPDFLPGQMATGFAKPGGIHRLTSDTWMTVMGDRPVDAIWGIGPRTSLRLADLGITTVRELASADPRELAKAFGPRIGPHLWWRGLGRSDATVDPTPYVPKSRSHEQTFPRDLTERADVDEQLHQLSWQLAREAAAEGRLAKRVAVKVRFAPYFTRSSVTTLPQPTTDGAEIERAAQTVLARFEPLRPLRLLGVRIDFADS